ncbi:MAG TPA: putative DNA binding domain-containing protein [Clostridiales bacterium]|nr:putative DNA binding domain-containing protein [Clostridiales bacterium]
MNIPINIETLLAGKVVESERIEYKKGWNPAEIMRTVAAFANDFENLGSGYIVVGVEEINGMAKRPVFGFDSAKFDKVQKEMIGFCNLMRPKYFPKMSLEDVDGKQVLLVWVTAGSNRPYEVPKDVTANKKDYEYFIRKYSSTIRVNDEQKHELFSLTANIPFDDRVNHKARIDDISPYLLRNHLRQINSRLYPQSETLPHKDLCVQMNLAEGADEHLLPKNVGLLLFNDTPEKYFPYTHISIVEFPNGAGGEEFYEKVFSGPVQQQLVNALAYIKAQTVKSKTVKIKGQAESKTFFNYPFEAVEEALANAVYHKNYEIREPIEVRIMPDSIEIISFGGPDPSVRMSDLNKGLIRVRRYRNRRIGEFLKELGLTEGKGTGIPTIKRALEVNGSPPAKYDTDGDERRYFVTEIPVHPEFLKEDSNQDSNQDEEKSNYVIAKLSSLLNQEINYDIAKNIKSTEKILTKIVMVLEFCFAPRTRDEIFDEIEMSNQTRNYNDIVKPAVDAGLVSMTIPKKPKSKYQKYLTTEKGKRLIESKND